MTPEQLAEARALISEITDPEYAYPVPPLFQRAADTIAALLASIDVLTAERDAALARAEKAEVCLRECLEVVERVSDGRAYRALKQRARAAIGEAK